MKLFGTPPSPFTRKIRALLLQHEIAHEFVVLNDLMSLDQTKFGENPLLMFPVLEDKGQKIVESDVIADYLHVHYIPGAATGIPELQANEQKYRNYNILSIINGVMEAGVHRLRAKRSGLENLDDYTFFRQEAQAIASGLSWLDRVLGETPNTSFSKNFGYLDLSLACALDWLVFREFLKDFAPYPNLKAFVKYSETIPVLRATKPVTPPAP